ncbi:MAG: hypothetical protein K6T78_08215 [Alicyclobacillus sp.]|nr:hypothetical protein [Alicyclobacillus sp.]
MALESDAFFSHLRVGPESVLRRKELYEYVTPEALYDVELYENSDGTYYAVAVPRDVERIVVYGSSVCSTAAAAMQSVMDKIHREGVGALFGGPTPSASNTNGPAEKGPADQPAPDGDA